MRPNLFTSTSLIVAVLAVGAFPSPSRAAWPHPPGQILLAASSGSVQAPVAVADSGGGMIVAWVDTRSDAGDIYVQRADHAGNVRWGANGLATGVSSGQQTNVVIAPDGAGGAFLAWEDHRNPDADIYCQHVIADGTIAPGWPASGLQLTSGSGAQLQPAMSRYSQPARDREPAGRARCSDPWRLRSGWRT